jgi:hypothetical protein
MNCNEFRTLLHACLDAEVDAPTAQDVSRHLELCPACRHQFQAEQQFNERLRQLLKPASKNDLLWQQQHQHIISAFDNLSRSTSPASIPGHGTQSADSAYGHHGRVPNDEQIEQHDTKTTINRCAGTWLPEKYRLWTSTITELLWPSPKYYLALALIWLLVVVLPVRVIEPDRDQSNRTASAPPNTQAVLSQQRKQLKELLSTSEFSERPETELNLPPLTEQFLNPTQTHGSGPEFVRARENLGLI